MATPDVEVQLAMPASDSDEQARSTLVRCPACETTVSSLTGQCSYCLEPLAGGVVVTSPTDAPDWGFEDLNDFVVDGPDAQIIVGPWVASAGEAGGSSPAVETATLPEADDAGLGAPAERDAADLAVVTDPAAAAHPAGRSDREGTADLAASAGPAAFAELAAPAEPATSASATANADLAVSAEPATSAIAMADADLATLADVGAPADPAGTDTLDTDTPVETAASCASWSARRKATLIDLAVFVPAIVALAINLTVGVMLLLDAVALLVWQTCFLQARTGQTMGKHLTKIYLVRESDRWVIGQRMAIWRELCHLADVTQLLSRNLATYRGPKRQTVADRLANTVVVTEPPSFTISGRGRTTRSDYEQGFTSEV